MQALHLLAQKEERPGIEAITEPQQMQLNAETHPHHDVYIYNLVIFDPLIAPLCIIVFKLASCVLVSFLYFTNSRYILEWRDTPTLQVITLQRDRCRDQIVTYNMGCASEFPYCS